MSHAPLHSLGLQHQLDALQHCRVVDEVAPDGKRIKTFFVTSAVTGMEQMAVQGIAYSKWVLWSASVIFLAGKQSCLPICMHCALPPCLCLASGCAAGAMDASLQVRTRTLGSLARLAMRSVLTALQCSAAFVASATCCSCALNQATAWQRTVLDMSIAACTPAHPLSAQVMQQSAIHRSVALQGIQNIRVLPAA